MRDWMRWGFGGYDDITNFSMGPLTVWWYPWKGRTCVGLTLRYWWRRNRSYMRGLWGWN